MKLDVKFAGNAQEIPAAMHGQSRTFSSGFAGTTFIHDGQNGATFTPAVSADGIISWTNDRELPNPEPVNIKGDRGERGPQGLQGIQGIPGVAGKDGAPGARGPQGIQGVQGVAGPQGQAGRDGKDGVGVARVYLKTIGMGDGATSTYVVELTDSSIGGTISVTNGSKGSDGKDGAPGVDGYTPVAGKDYFTAAEKAEMVAAVRAQLITEQWTFVLSDGTTVTKDVVVE